MTEPQRTQVHGFLQCSECYRLFSCDEAFDLHRVRNKCVIGHKSELLGEISRTGEGIVWKLRH